MKKVVVAVTVLILASVLPLISCKNNKKSFSNKNIQEGYELAQKYCTTCHLFPEPELLNKITWGRYVLPQMGNLLGFQRFASDYVESDTSAMITLEQWRNIVRYYTSEAPEEPLERDKPSPEIKIRLPYFKIEGLNGVTSHPSTTMVKIQPGTKEILFGDGLSGNMYRVNDKLSLVDSLHIGTGIAIVHHGDSGIFALTMGVLYPSDVKSGKLEVFQPSLSKSYTLLDSLQRPVHAAFVDLNEDDAEDIIICEFGNTTGQLSWFENRGDKKFIKHILRSFPGSVKTEIYDFNKDGKPDIMALMAQGEEGFFIYYNKGNGKFKEQKALRLSPSHGSNYFELADFNKDGFPDIIASNGDNGDYPPIMKAYHGIRIYFNNGKNEFEERIFLAVNGVGKVIAEDFDFDGDLDLASISYFPDYKNSPQESFIFWKNNGDLKFTAYSFPEATSGRWLTMDAGDADGDGDIDVVLGNAKFTVGAIPPELMRKWDHYSTSVLMIRNTIR
jgi:hypothetical protein